MTASFNEKLISYLTLLSGICISAVAVYYSVVGLASIFSAAVVPIIIMGIALEASKLIATVWLKLNWKIAPVGVRVYLLIAIAVLMLITSIGIFGFLSRAHSDQKLAGGAVTEQLAIYDQKIQVSKDRIEMLRKTLVQLDNSVDQLMTRSTNERGANKAITLRKAQSKERTQLLSDVDAEQQKINTLVEESTPLRNKLRAVESEVGPIKYIAEFIYGNTDSKLLERAVTWMIITLIVVFDPLAVVLLLAAQTSFQHLRSGAHHATAEPVEEIKSDTSENVATAMAEVKPVNLGQDTEPSILDQHPYLNQPFMHFTNLKPVVAVAAKEPPVPAIHDEPAKSTAWVPATPSNITQEQYLKAAQEYLKWR